MKTRLAPSVLLPVVLAALWAVPAAAGSIYLNGENIDEVRNMKFDKCSVRIDEQGNVIIEAAGYRVKRVEGEASRPPPSPPVQPQPVQAMAPVPQPQVQTPAPPSPVQPAAITRRYWLVSSQNAAGLTEFDIDVYINAKWLMTLRNTSQQDVAEITRFLVPGQNSVTLEAKKISKGPRKSFSTEHQFVVVIGEGDAGGEKLMISNALVNFKRTAADPDSVSKDYTFVTR